MRPPPTRHTDYRRFTTITPRLNDTDAFGHINNAVYYEFFDTAVMRFMIDEGCVSLEDDGPACVVVESGCRYHSELTFSDHITVGLRTVHVGRTSVRYEIGIFRNNGELAAADGHFTHVFVDRDTMRPTEIPAHGREVMMRVMAG